MADRQTIRGSSAANPELRGSVRAEDGSHVFVYSGGLDLDEIGEFVVSRGPNVVLEVIDAGAMSARTVPRRQKRSPDTAPSTSNCVLPPRSVSSHCCSATAGAERLGHESASSNVIAWTTAEPRVASAGVGRASG